MAYDTAEMTPEREAELRALLERLDASSTKIDLVDRALTHRSYAFENPPAIDNERLEFLGDSVIGFIVAEYFFRRYPDADEGDLSKKKARVVSRSLLGAVTRDLDLGPLIRLGRGEDRTGGRERASLLGSALEALVGAIYISDGHEAAAAFVDGQLIEPLLHLLEEEEAWDYKSRFQEYVQKRFQTTPTYQTLETSGPDHDKLFRVRVSVNGDEYGEATASRKKTAENLAAKAALERIENGDADA